MCKKTIIIRNLVYDCFTVVLCILPAYPNILMNFQRLLMWASSGVQSSSFGRLNPPFNCSTVGWESKDRGGSGLSGRRQQSLELKILLVIVLGAYCYFWHFKKGLTEFHTQSRCLLNLGENQNKQIAHPL